MTRENLGDDSEWEDVEDDEIFPILELTLCSHVPNKDIIHKINLHYTNYEALPEDIFIKKASDGEEKVKIITMCCNVRADTDGAHDISVSHIHCYAIEKDFALEFALECTKNTLKGLSFGLNELGVGHTLNESVIPDANTISVLLNSSIKIMPIPDDVIQEITKNAIEAGPECLEYSVDPNTCNLGGHIYALVGGVFHADGVAV